jgi:hypothetical protein
LWKQRVGSFARASGFGLTVSYNWVSAEDWSATDVIGVRMAVNQVGDGLDFRNRF